MTPARNVLIVTHVVTGLVGAGVVLGAFAIRRRSRTSCGCDRKSALGVDVRPDLLGAFSEAEYLRLCVCMQKQAARHAQEADDYLDTVLRSRGQVRLNSGR